jgi:hypothetical protein
MQPWMDGWMNGSIEFPQVIGQTIRKGEISLDWMLFPRDEQSDATAVPVHHPKHSFV